MSYPSIRHVDPKNLTDAEREAALFKAFHADLPLGMSFIEKNVGKIKNSEDRELILEDPNSPTGKQLIRLLGTDIARGILEKRFGVALGLYNCCGVVMAKDRNSLNMTMQEQILLQNGVLASADC